MLGNTSGEKYADEIDFYVYFPLAAVFPNQRLRKNVQLMSLSKQSANSLLSHPPPKPSLTLSYCLTTLLFLLFILLVKVKEQCLSF